jgi:hypothetical protein
MDNKNWCNILIGNKAIAVSIITKNKSKYKHMYIGIIIIIIVVVVAVVVVVVCYWSTHCLVKYSSGHISVTTLHLSKTG